MIERRCKFIVAVDGEEDANIHCFSLMELIRNVRMGMGIEIEIDVRPLSPSDGVSGRNWAVGTIHYSDKEKGTLLYLKSCITGDEPQDLLDYRRRYPAFPHDSTSHTYGFSPVCVRLCTFK